MFAQSGQYLGQPLGTVAEGQFTAVPQQAERAGADVGQGAQALMAGGGPGGVGALGPAGKIRRVAGGQVIPAGLAGAGDPAAQVGADRADVPDVLVGRRPGQQFAGLGLDLQGQAGAAVALVVPFQRHHPASRAQVGGPLVPAGDGKAGQQQRVGAKAVGGRAVDAGPIIQNFR